jgi:hypothetical protein
VYSGSKQRLGGIIMINDRFITIVTVVHRIKLFMAKLMKKNEFHIHTSQYKKHSYISMGTLLACHQKLQDLQCGVGNLSQFPGF